MNDNHDPRWRDEHVTPFEPDDNDDPLFAIEPPDWVWDISARYELCERTDCPHTMVMVMLADAGDLLQQASDSALRDRAMSSDTKRRVAKVKAMIADAEKLYPFCPTQPSPGNVTESDDGTLTCWPAPDRS